MPKQQTTNRRTNTLKSNSKFLRMFSGLSKRTAGIIGVVLFAIIGAAIVVFTKAEDPNAISVGIIKTQYAYPSGSLFVAPNGVDDTTAGAVGKPYKTISYAVKRAATGSTIVVRAGVYREEIGTINKPLTIQPYPNEDVWLDGSDVVSGWVQDGTMWRKDSWTAGNVLCPSSDCYDKKLVIDADNPAAGLPDMVFVDGSSIKQVMTLAEVKSDTFYIDRAAQKLYMGTNPSGRTVEASTRREAMFYYSSATAGAKLRGIGVRRYAGNIEFSNRAKPGQINATSGARGIEIENVVITQGAANGLFIAGLDGNSAPGITIKNSLFANNGASGVSATRVDGFVMDNNIFYNNDNQKPNVDGDYGSYAGSKITYMTNSDIRNNLFQDNYGTGLWCDLSCDNNRITGNMSRGNTLDGVFYEVSSNAIIASNVSYGNGRYGFKVGGRNIKVYNNTAYNNVSENIFLYDDGRLTSQNLEVKNNIVANGPRTAGTSHLIYARPNMSNVGTVVTGLDYNLYFRSASTSPKYVLGWQGTNIDAHYTTLDATVRNQTGREAQGVLVEGKALGTIFKDASNGNFQLVAGSQAVDSAAPLPADVAAATGQSAGQVVSRGAIQWRNGSSSLLASATPEAITPPAVPANVVPTASVSVSSSSLISPATFQVTATASDVDGSITRLEILQNGQPVMACSAAKTCRYDAAGYGPGTFQYTARATDDAAQPAQTVSSSQSVVVSLAAATTPTPVPAPVSALAKPVNIKTGAEQGFLSIGLWFKWDAVSGATGYKVTPLGRSSVARSTNSYVDAGVAPGTVYSYEISATNGTIESPKTTVSAQVTCGFWVFNCTASVLSIK